MKNIFHSGRSARDGESRPDQKMPALPVTDWCFQAITPLRGGSSSFGKQRKSFRDLRALGANYFDKEAKRHERIDGAVFGAIAAMSAWPMTAAAQAIFALIK